MPRAVCGGSQQPVNTVVGHPPTCLPRATGAPSIVTGGSSSQRRCSRDDFGSWRQLDPRRGFALPKGYALQRGNSQTLCRADRRRKSDRCPVRARQRPRCSPVEGYFVLRVMATDCHLACNVINVIHELPPRLLNCIAPALPPLVRDVCATRLMHHEPSAPPGQKDRETPPARSDRVPARFRTLTTTTVQCALLRWWPYSSRPTRRPPPPPFSENDPRTIVPQAACGCTWSWVSWAWTWTPWAVPPAVLAVVGALLDHAGELVRGEMDEMRGEMRALRADNSELSRRLGSLERVESEWNRTAGGGEAADPRRRAQYIPEPEHPPSLGEPVRIIKPQSRGNS